MEEILKQILNKIDALGKRMDAYDRSNKEVRQCPHFTSYYCCSAG